MNNTYRVPTNKSSAQAFTLIELLVVIAIIAILAAILFPVFAQAREKARQATDQSNLKQLGLAFLQYQQDYDEFFPPSVTERYAPSTDYTVYGSSSSSSGFVDTQSEAAQFSIEGLLNPYVKAQNLYADPSNPTPWVAPTVSTAGSSSAIQTLNGVKLTAWFPSDYGFNFDESVWDSTYFGTGYDGYGSTSTPPNPAVVPSASLFEGTSVTAATPFVGDGFNGLYNLAKITAPGTFILAADTARAGKASRGSLTPNGALLADQKTFYALGSWPPISGFTANSGQASIALRHSGKADFLFGDGHVKLLAPEQVYSVSGGVTTNYFARQQ